MTDSQKYPKTYHLPISPGLSRDDKVQYDLSGILKTPIIITEKMDGSNVCLERDACYARTHSGPPTHASFDYFKSIHQTVCGFIPPGVQIFGEWLYALHSIPYDSLPSYFLAFGVREGNEWLSWEDVKLYAADLDLPTVPELYSGVVETEKELNELVSNLVQGNSSCGKEKEGLVIRSANSFSDSDFNMKILKWVRKNHVQTSEHWRNQEIVKNKLYDRS